MYFASLLLLGALGVSAHPSGHAHLHNHARYANAHSHEERAADVVTVTATIYGKVVTWTQAGGDGSPFVKGHRATTSSAPVPTTTSHTPTTLAVVATSSAAAPPASSSTSAAAPSSGSSSGSGSSSSGSGVTSFTSFSSACKASKKRATAAQIAYTGNTGAKYGSYGCNFLKVASDDVAAKYDNYIKFYGATTDKQCIMWNKIGVDGGINGFWGKDALEFTLKAGTHQYIAVDANSQGGAACFDGDIGKTSIGEIAGAWVEFDFQNSSNDNYSGADASVIVAQTSGLSFPGLSVCRVGDSSDCSTITSSGVSSNAYLAKDVDADGIGIKGPGPLKLEANVGF